MWSSPCNSSLIISEMISQSPPAKPAPIAKPALQPPDNVRPATLELSLPTAHAKPAPQGRSRQEEVLCVNLVSVAPSATPATDNAYLQNHRDKQFLSMRSS